MGDILDQDVITALVQAKDLPADQVNRKITRYYHQLSEAIRTS